VAVRDLDFPAWISNTRTSIEIFTIGQRRLLVSSFFAGDTKFIDFAGSAANLLKLFFAANYNFVTIS